MKNYLFFVFYFAVLLSLFTCGTDDKVRKNKVSVEKINYHGWQESYRISNGQIDVVVVPAIGRIMYFGFKGEENILWNNPLFFGKTLPAGKPLSDNGEIIWANFGGDKVWPTQEDQWQDINGRTWPADHWFDGSAHMAEVLANGIKIIGPVSEYCGARSIREIILAEAGAELTINQTIEKVQQADNSAIEPINYTIWNITQICSPLMALMNLNPNRRLSKRHKLFRPNTAENFSIEGDMGILLPDRKNKQKVGADSDYWLAAIVDSTVIGEFFRLQPNANYPDEGMSVEVYTEPDYTELEILSPLRQLAIGESMLFTINWRLHQLPTELNTDREKRTAALTWLNIFVD